MFTLSLIKRGKLAERKDLFMACYLGPVYALKKEKEGRKKSKKNSVCPPPPPPQGILEYSLHVTEGLIPNQIAPITGPV